MGTRHHQVVITKSGEMKISQYGQWDGYPDGQGKDILTFLKSADLEKYHEEVFKVRQITNEESKAVDDDKNWTVNYPHLSRDGGSNIHQLILDGKVEFAALIDQEEADKWCRGFYTIDFSKNEFRSEYGGTESSWPLDALPSNEDYLKTFLNEDEE